MRATFAIPAILVLTMIAGCVAPAEPSETSDTVGTEDPAGPTNDTNSTNTTEPTSTNSTLGNSTNSTMNNPPSANLTHDLENDSVSVNTTFNFTVNGTDPDGDNLTWELDVDGDNVSDYNGTDAEFGMVEHNYTENGTFNVTLIVSDGMEEANSSVTINVTAGSSGARFQDSVLLPCPTCPDITTDAVEFELTPDLVGMPFLVESTAGDPDIAFAAEDCDGDLIEHDNGGGAEEGEVPEGAGCIIVWEYLEPDSDITVTIGTPPPEEEEEP